MSDKNFVREALNAKKMVDMDRQAVHVADQLQHLLNKSKLSAPVACMAIFEVYSRTKAFYPDIMAVCEKRLSTPTDKLEAQDDGKPS